MKKWLENYYLLYQKALSNDNIFSELEIFKDKCIEMKLNGKKLLLAGNGASASIASHAATDFTKQAKIRAQCFTDPNLITAFANDYGYEFWVNKAIEFYHDEGDVIVLISSSGKSKNLINAAKYAKSKGLYVITFTGFDENNELRQNGDLNFWLNSRAYNIIECTHMIWITTVVDMIIGKAEYSVV